MRSKFLKILGSALIGFSFQGYSQDIDLGIPSKPEYTPAGYAWVLQQENDGDLRWVAKEMEAEASVEEPAKPTADLPLGYDWYPVYKEDKLVAWKAESWYESNRGLFEWMGGILASLLSSGIGYLVGNRKITPKSKPKAA